MFEKLFGNSKPVEAPKLTSVEALAAEKAFLASLAVKSGSDAEKMKSLFEEINDTLIAKGTLPEHNA